MEKEFSFNIDSYDLFDKINVILQDLEKLTKNILKVLEKLEELLQNFEPGSLLPKASMNFNRSDINKSMDSNQIPSNSDNVRNTTEQPIVSGLHEIAGLQSIKASLRTLLVLPRQQPQLFQNRSVSNSILLYGPPGTGKTRLVHGLAAESGAELHSISVSDLLSSFVGETEKNIKQIFSYLKNGPFSILFIDELDGLCRKRCSSENEYSRRIKTELMCQMTKTEHNANMVIIAATNCPWDLDVAILRRFQKRTYVPLPNSEERLELFQLFTKDIEIVSNTPEESEELIKISEGFSGSDISSLVQEALDIPLTELQDTTIWIMTEGIYVPFTNEGPSINMENYHIGNLKDLPSFSVKARPVTVTDFLEAAKRVQVTVKSKDIKKYEMFKNK